MKFFSQAIQMISAPNMFIPHIDNLWSISDSVAVDLWFQITIQDQLGVRRYLPEALSNVQAVFLRPDELSIAQTAPVKAMAEPKTLTKMAVADPQDSSLYKLAMTLEDVKAIHSGSVKFIITQPTLPIIEYVTDNFLTKTYTSAGW